MLNDGITSIIANSLLKDIRDVKMRSNDSSVINSTSFEDILSSKLLNSGNCCSCNYYSSGTSSLELLGLVTSILGNDKDIGSSTLSNTVNVGVTTSVNTVSSSVSNSKMDKAMSLLKEQLGKPYVWGANGPSSFDCSGLTRYIYKEALGKDIPRVSYDQAKFGTAVDKSDLQKGDLVFFDTMNKGRVSHVGIYIGNNEFIHASNPKDGVKLSKLEGYYANKYRGARRP